MATKAIQYDVQYRESNWPAYRWQALGHPTTDLAKAKALAESYAVARQRALQFGFEFRVWPVEKPGQAWVLLAPDVFVNVAAFVGCLEDLPERDQWGWVKAAGNKNVTVGETAYVDGFGKMRLGIVTKVGRTRITVAFTTPSTIDEANRRGHGITIYASPKSAHLVKVYRAWDA